METITTNNLTYNNFVSVRPLTEEEARKVYSKMKKEKLIEMLIACNKLVDSLYAELGRREHPFPGYEYHNLDCTDWAHCRNPQMDCVNCPLRALPSDYIIKPSTIGTGTTDNSGTLK